jgi:hypothetical protein
VVIEIQAAHHPDEGHEQRIEEYEVQDQAGEDANGDQREDQQEAENFSNHG